jgi:hypothetical protein
VNERRTYRGGPTTKFPECMVPSAVQATSNEAGPARPAFALVVRRNQGGNCRGPLIPYCRSDDKCWGAISGDLGSQGRHRYPDPRGDRQSHRPGQGCWRQSSRASTLRHRHRGAQGRRQTRNQFAGCTSKPKSIEIPWRAPRTKRLPSKIKLADFPVLIRASSAVGC